MSAMLDADRMTEHDKEMRFSAGLPLHTIYGGTLSSPLHPDTNKIFQYSGKRQALGGVLPLVRPADQPTLRTTKEMQDDARARWFKAYAISRQEEANTLNKQEGRTRTAGSSDLLGHTEESSKGWVWQSWRGWTSTSRMRHERSMQEKWAKETRDSWCLQSALPSLER
mmetsp:Transcript_22452/g.40528  ORF Transcript_22452/g.40528 Transcript_22452/m.40528 type:complete len:168 (-) Transcript_22452:192-695(-)